MRKERVEVQSIKSPAKKEEFHFVLLDNESLKLVLDLHNSTDDDNRIFFEVKVFTDEGGSSFVEPNRPAEGTSLQLKVRFSPTSEVLALNRSIYLHGRYSLQFRPLYYLEFTNNYDRRAYVMVAVEMMRNTVPSTVVAPLSDKLLQIVENERVQCP